jgi:hypothetical protein
MRPSRIAFTALGIALALAAAPSARRALHPRGSRAAVSISSPFRRIPNPFARTTRVVMPGVEAPEEAKKAAPAVPRPAVHGGAKEAPAAKPGRAAAEPAAGDAAEPVNDAGGGAETPAPAETGPAPTPPPGATPYERPQGKITQPLYITTGALPDASPGQPYSAVMEATGGTPPYAWSITSGGLPASLSLAPASGAIDGVPEEPGRALFRVSVTDADRNTDTVEQSITVKGEALAILTEALAEGRAGERYEQELSATGGAPPYSWQSYPVSLPAGLSIDPSRGVISGTPERAGDTPLTIGVLDARGEKASAKFDLVIRAAALVIATSSLPQGLRGAPYQASLAAEGGIAPYRWSLAGGELPAGLSLDASSGIISGTASGNTGYYPLLVSVADASADRASRELVLAVMEDLSLSVTDLAATPSDRKVALTWTNPPQAEYAYTIIVRNTAAPPAGPEDGIVVYRGDGVDFLDRDLQNGVACHYAAIACTSAGAAGAVSDGARASAVPMAVTLTGPADPYADEVVSFSPLSPGGFGSSSLSWALGPPRGAGWAMGSTHVVSLHARANTDGGASAPYGGSITLAFADNIVVNGPGNDFTVFENAFYAGGDPSRRWMEPAIVSVSKDGKRFFTFPFDFVPHFNTDGTPNCYNPYCYINADGSSRGFAGVTPVHSVNGNPDPRIAAAGGDSFDLDSITAARLDWIRYVRITATGDNWLVDINGDRVRHVTDMGSCSGAGASGFDLDAVCAINY